MRKRISKPSDISDSASGPWLDLASLACVEITSECDWSPIEAALTSDVGTGWKASEPGIQVIRLLFDEPTTIQRVLLEFVEKDTDRTHEFSLRWSKDGEVYDEIVRQRWNFSPAGATHEREDYQFDLQNARVLELRIIPDIRGGSALASLAQLRLA